MTQEPTEQPSSSTYVTDLELQVSILKARQNAIKEQYRIHTYDTDLTTSNFKSIPQDVKNEWNAIGRLIVQSKLAIRDYQKEFETDDDYHRHESYGSIVLSNPTGGSGNLFGSGVKHQHYVSLSIHTAYLKRDLNHDWIHPSRQIIEVNMSHEQWGRFVSSGGRGEGTPCTISSIGLRTIDSPPFYSKPMQFKKELMDDLKDLTARVDSLSAVVEPLKQPGTINKATKDAIVGSIETLQRELNKNMPYVIDSYVKAMEKVTSQAKTEIESYVNHVAQSVGMDVIKQNASTVLQIESDNKEE